MPSSEPGSQGSQVEGGSMALDLPQYPSVHLGFQKQSERVSNLLAARVCGGHLCVDDL